MLKKGSIIISKYFFLLLFLGFLGSITLFNHVHVVNGITIVHSHPFKSDSNGKPIHSHSDKEFITIQLVSVVSIVTIILYFTLETVRPQSSEVVTTRQDIVNQIFHHFYSLRAPPRGIFN